MGEIASRGLQRGGGIEFVEAIETMVSNIYIYLFIYLVLTKESFDLLSNRLSRRRRIFSISITLSPPGHECNCRGNCSGGERVDRVLLKCFSIV